MLATPLPGLIDFTLAGPGATNGPLTAQTLGSYSNNPQAVEHLFDQYSSETGFAGWIKTWQDNTGSSQVVEIAIRFHQSAEAATNASAFVSTLSKGLSGGTRSNVASIPGASAFTIGEPASTSGSITIPAQQVQAVIFTVGDYLVALHTDSPSGAGAHPIAAGTAIALALQQYQVLSAEILAQTPKPPPKKQSGGGSTVQIVGFIMLGAVALVILGLALVSWRRRQSEALRRGSALAASAPAGSAPAGSAPAGNAAAGSAAASVRPAQMARGTKPSRRPAPERRRSWPESPALPNGASTQGATNGTNHDQTVRGGPDHNKTRNGVDRNRIPARPAADASSTKKRVPFGRPPRKSTATPARTDDEQLVSAGAPGSRATRTQRLETSRTNHPSASVALANARPPDDIAGWYRDPSDSQQRRIRYWDGNAWTSHVAEPEA